MAYIRLLQVCKPEEYAEELCQKAKTEDVAMVLVPMRKRVSTIVEDNWILSLRKSYVESFIWPTFS